MNQNTLFLALLGMAGAGAFWFYQQQQNTQAAPAAAPTSTGGSGSTWADLMSQFSSSFSNAGQTVTSALSNVPIVGGLVQVSAMNGLDWRAALANANVQAMLKVIRTGEGTSGPNGYNMLFGGGLFSGYAHHPNKTVCSGSLCSTAAGAYQLLYSSWEETKNAMGLPDFSPQSQDAAAVGRMAARGALSDVMAGNFTSAVQKLAYEWASLPGSPYGQPTISMSKAQSVFAYAGGVAVA